MSEQQVSTTKPKARELNNEIRYCLYAVFRARATLDDLDRAGAAAEIDDLLDTYAAKGVTTRGLYDASGYRADADVLAWWVAKSPDDLQEINAAFRRTRLGRLLDPAWNAMAVHRPAEFNKSHIPAWLAGTEPKRYISIYPYARSYEWYLLPDTDRRHMLAEHGKMARDYPDVLSNTAAAFALGDYEWMLSFEADELHRIVDLMRHLRGAEARRHTRLEIPFYTGVRKPAAELVAALP